MSDQEFNPQMTPGIIKLGQVTAGTSDKIASLITEEQWEIITGRQEMFAPHRETKSIFLRSVPDPTAKNDKDMFFAQGLLRDHEVVEIYRSEINALLSDISKFYTVIDWAASLILLPAGQTVKRHKDTYPGPANLHRIHLPIITNPQCIFYCGAYRVNMKIDTIYEVRNLNYIHGVDNFGSTDRVHLVIDVMGDAVT